MPSEWELLIGVIESVRTLQDPVEIQTLAVRSIGERLQASRASYAFIEGDELVVSRSWQHDVPPTHARSPVDSFGQAVLDQWRKGETVAVISAADDPRFTDAEREKLAGNQTAAFIATPLIKNGQWVALFGVFDREPRHWTAGQVALIEIAAQGIWWSGERARAERRLGRVENRQAFLRQLSGAIRPLADPAHILRETCRLLGTHLHANRVMYGEIEGDDCIVVNDYTDGLPSLAGQFRWTALAGSRRPDILKGDTLVVNDISIGPHTAEERAVLQSSGIGAYITPLLVKDGRLVAAFGIHSSSPRVWTTDEITLVQEVADRIWTTLEHRRAEAELRKNEERLAFLLRLNDALRGLSDPADVQATASRMLGEYINAGRVGYAEVAAGNSTISREHARGVAPLAGRPLDLALGPELLAALHRGEAVVVTDMRTDPRFTDENRAGFLSRQIQAFIGVALIKDGQMIAAFGANHDTPRVWTPGEVDVVRDVASRTWDAVERTRAVAALRQGEERLRLALDASAGGSWTWNAATNQTDWDDQFRALYGFAADEPSAPDKWPERLHPDDRARILALLNEITTTAKDSWESTFRIVLPDGTVRWLQSRGRAERDAAGKLMRLTGLDLDFSSHQRTEEARQTRRDEEHDRTLRTLFETATQGIVSVDSLGVIQFANAAFEEMFGWEAGTLVGQPARHLIPSVFSDPDTRPGTVGLGRRKDGSTFPIEISVTHVPTPSGGRAFGFVTDITERQRVAVALEERTAELEYRTTQLSQMASDLTLAEQRAREEIAKTLHDGLQQLLVIGALNLEREMKQRSEAGTAPSPLVSSAKQHLDEAIAAARSLSIELFPPVLHRSGLPAALKWLADWTREKYRVDVQVVADPRADSSRTEVRALLFESVRELLFNAVKHGRTDRIHLELGIDDSGDLRITVTDPGVGFDQAAFESRSNATRAGWGLFSIRERLMLLGGHMDVYSAVGRGTRIRLVAPVEAPRAVEAGIARLSVAAAAILPAPVTGAGAAKAGALKILLVDDHAAFRAAKRSLLEERPEFSVIGEAANGLEAIARAHALLPDVILMDVTMPHMDGVEATAQILAALPHIEILGLSMQPRTADLHPIQEAGAAAYFMKGVETQPLIDHLLALHAARRQAAAAERPRVLLADDHPGILKALDNLLSPDCDIVGIVSDGGAVADAWARLHPVVTVVDLNLPTLSGLDVCREIRQRNPSAKVILMTGMVDDIMRAEAAAAGASGFLQKSAAGSELLPAIKQVWTEPH